MTDPGELADVGVRDPGEDVDEQLERRIAGDRGQLEMEPAEIRRPAALLFRDQRTQAGDTRLGQAAGRELHDRLLDREPGLEELVETDLGEGEVHHDRVDHRRDRRGGDHETTTGATTRPRDTCVLDEPHGLPEHVAADAVALDQLALGTEHLSFGPTELDDLGDHTVGDPRREPGFAALRAHGSRGFAAEGGVLPLVSRVPFPSMGGLNSTDGPGSFMGASDRSGRPRPSHPPRRGTGRGSPDPPRPASPTSRRFPAT